jgi:hypothetical protein
LILYTATIMPFSPISVVPSRLENLVFLAKAKILQMIRSGQNICNPALRKWSSKSATDVLDLPVGAESVSKLWVGATANEWVLQAGKIHNLRQAIQQIDGITIPAGEIFSFWAQVGRPSKFKGYAVGRELREGCIIPTIGGGLCQLSNALYDAALKAGLEIIERHAHNQVIPGSLAEIDRDATVFWNYVDLRFRVATPLKIEAKMDDQKLTIRFYTEQATSKQTNPITILPIVPANSCLSCGVTTCFRQQQPQVLNSRTAYLVDDYWPEFDRYLQMQRTDRDYLLLPVDGQQIKKANYAWTTSGFGQISQHRSILAVRAAQSMLLRTIPNQGAKHQKLLMSQSRYLARIYGDNLAVDATHIVVTQSLLPHLWQGGYLRGRSFDVLMTALPMQKLQSRLNAAAVKHPQSPTLNNFRVSSTIAAAEMAALQQAKRIVTPHLELAALWPEKTELLDWILPKVALNSMATPALKPIVLLPAASLGRKGIYELKAALTGLDLHLIVAGSELEEPGFWQGYEMEYSSDYSQALQRATVVVLPGWVEHQPRRLLQSIAQGVPTIASTACGLPSTLGATQVPIGDVAALRLAIIAATHQQPAKNIRNALELESAFN